MGRTVSFSDLREEVRLAYDLPTFSATTFVTTTAVNSFINKSLQAFYALLLECYGDNYFADSSTLTTANGVSLTSLPGRFVKLLALHWERTSTDMVKLRPASADDLHLAGRGATSWSTYCPKYRLSGTGALEWFPTPNAAYSVRCDYVALPSDLALDADTFDAGPGWEEWVIADVCRKIARREEKPLDTWLTDRGIAEQRIRAQAPERDEGEALTIRDVYGGGESAWQRRDRLTLGDG